MERTELIEHFKDFFGFLTEEDIHLILDIGEFKSYKSKQLILGEHHASKLVLFILDGTVRGFVINEEGEEDTVMLRSKGVFIGDANALFMGSPPNLNLQALAPTLGILFDFHKFEALASENKRVMHLYLWGLKEIILRLTYRVMGMITLTNEERYLNLLELNPLFLKDSYDKYLATYLGITPVSLSRIKKRLLERENLDKSKEQ